MIKISKNLKIFIAFILLTILLIIIILITHYKVNLIKFKDSDISHFNTTINSDTDLEKLENIKKENQEATKSKSAETEEEKNLIQENLLQIKKELEKLVQ
ncbi:MAG: hypothetical protein HFJ50_04785 [Clostridia bacterium]|nr:hypothetical protein [Clostridia bacterium]